MRSSVRHTLPLILAVVWLASCSKSDAPANTTPAFLGYTLPQQKTPAALASGSKSVRIRLADTVTHAEGLIAQFTLNGNATATIGSTPQSSGLTPNNFEQDLVYTLNSADHSNQVNWTVTATNTDYSYDWGLGHILKQKGNVSDPGYEWYIDQGGTGTYALQNCGPTCVTMASKWADPAFSKTPEDARAKYESGGGWWFTPDIDACLTDYQVPHITVNLPSTAGLARDQWMRQVDSGRLVLLCIDMNYITPGSLSTYHVDKFYPTTPGWGHFFIIKGYQQVDGEYFMDVYDPYSIGQLNADGTFKGKDRFYRYEDIYQAASNWWNFAFLIARKSAPFDINTQRRSLNHAQIDAAHGQ